MMRLYVGRGGEKLDSGIEHFQLDVSGRVALDVGCSTGGFTDCLLRYGASFVYAVDVGVAQFSSKLLRDQRVKLLQKCNARYLTPEVFFQPISFCVMDLSFISVRKVLPAVSACLELHAELLILVKPQFELEKNAVSAGGVVVEEASRRRAVRLVAECCEELGMEVRGDFLCPVRGKKKGNREYFLYAALGE